MSLKSCEPRFHISPEQINSKFDPRRENYGRLFAYDKTYDRVTTKTERPLQPLDRMKYNPTTSDDPVIQQVRQFQLFHLNWFNFD
jgi:hypothetical protein